MVTLPSEPHRSRDIAEGFGTDASGYGRARPTYPMALVDWIDDLAAGDRMLDIGCGTGISSVPFVGRGYQVLGIEPDQRMAEVARRSGITVEPGRIETWDARGRTFDVAIAGQAWHWVDPSTGAGKLADVLVSAGVFVAFWNAMQLPPGIATAVAGVYAEVAPESPMARFAESDRPAADVYLSGFDRVEDALRAAGFVEPQRWRTDWQRRYTTGEYLELFPTFGGHQQLPAGTLARLSSGIGAVIDAQGGQFTMDYATVATSARRG